MREDDRLEQKEELQLLLRHLTDRGYEKRQVAIDLALDRGSGVTLRGLQISTIVGAADFDQAFCRAANRADVSA